MAENAKEFIRLMESRETWGFRNDPWLLERATYLAELITENPHASAKVPLNLWLIYLAMLPYSKAIDCISDLSLVLPNTLLKLVSIKSNNNLTNASRELLIERLNPLVRRKLHNEVLTKTRREAILAALEYIDGDN